MERPRTIAFSQARGPTGRVSQQVSCAPPMHSPESAKEAFAVELARFLDQTDGVAKSGQLFESLSAFALNFEFPWIAYRPYAADHTFKPLRRNPAIVSYPDEWQEHYVKMGYDRIDPIIKKSRKQARAFRWTEVYDDVSTTEVERRFFDEAAAFGLKSGVSVPLHGPDGGFAIMNFARPSYLHLQNKTITYLQFAAIQFHLTVAEFANRSDLTKSPTLSPRERECILWVARGKSSWDIGRILNISANTVNFHIKNITRKFDVTNRTVAALKAVSLGIIEL
ncbi:Transcriptional activator protein LasR [Ensifer psoraleae]|uniref:LuxR family transcriptional regulator n=1 Tax=Sinorhizobium psoraleae TaxID=520838 RepID=UPI001567DAAE|nr:LuxR family transcriptional regulator [Sinorhizobium psoraleae]NRP70947.1 Transcriptional activator protein LasR [Sinorhizobium psoraleae]